MDCSPPGSSVHGISQARILKMIAISFSRGSSPSVIEPMSPAWQADSLPLSHLGSPILYFSSVQLLSCVWLFSTPWTTAHQTYLYFTNSQSLLKLMPIELVMPSDHLIPYPPLLLPPQSSIRVFSNKSVLPIRWPKYWSFSFNISPFSEYSGLISLGLTGWLSIQSKGLSRVFSNTTVQNHQFFNTQLSL